MTNFFKQASKYSDLVAAGAVVLVVVMMIIPLPAFVLDLAITGATARDVLALGAPEGPRVGALLRAVRQWWLDGGCVAGPEACRADMRAVGVADPAACVFVGDRPYDDIHGAKQAGMRAVLRPNSCVPGYDSAVPDAVITRLPELLRHLNAW